MFWNLTKCIIQVYNYCIFRALSINPEPKIMDNLGVLYISAGRISEANKLYRDLYEKYGNYVEGKVHFVSYLNLILLSISVFYEDHSNETQSYVYVTG